MEEEQTNAMDVFKLPIFNGNEALNAMIMPGFPIMQETMKLNDDIGTNRKFRSQHGKHFLMPVLLCHYYSLSIRLKIYKKYLLNSMKVEKNMEQRMLHVQEQPK